MTEEIKYILWLVERDLIVKYDNPKVKADDKVTEI